MLAQLSVLPGGNGSIKTVMSYREGYEKHKQADIDTQDRCCASVGSSQLRENSMWTRNWQAGNQPSCYELCCGSSASLYTSSPLQLYLLSIHPSLPSSPSPLAVDARCIIILTEGANIISNTPLYRQTIAVVNFQLYWSAKETLTTQLTLMTPTHFHVLGSCFYDPIFD